MYLCTVTFRTDINGILKSVILRCFDKSWSTIWVCTEKTDYAREILKAYTSNIHLKPTTCNNTASILVSECGSFFHVVDEANLLERCAWSPAWQPHFPRRSETCQHCAEADPIHFIAAPFADNTITSCLYHFQLTKMPWTSLDTPKQQIIP